MKNLTGTKNAGYTIIKQGHIAVIAKNDHQYVTWHYKIDGNTTEYFWGRYGSKEHVEDCYQKKENGVYSG